jgi:predicted class III extradiol MEMO1 family dioxygenase
MCMNITIQQRPSSKTNSCSTSQEISLHFMEPTIHYHLHKSLPLVPIQLIQSTLSQAISLRFGLILSSHICLLVSTPYA